MLRDSREMNYDSKLQNMSWFCYNMWTCCPRQAWPQSSLTIKHYRVLVRNHHRWYRSPCALLILVQVNQWLGVLGNTYGMKMISLSGHRILCTCMTDLEWFQRKQHWLSRIHGGNLHQTHMSWRKSLLTSEHMLHARDMKIMLIKVSNTSWMFNTNHGWDKMLLMGSTTSYRDFHGDGIP